MRMESGALIAENVRVRNQLDIAKKALRFYSDGKHFDTVHVDGDPVDINRTRILDTGGVAEEALKRMEEADAGNGFGPLP